jgi:hypothetical protein
MGVGKDRDHVLGPEREKRKIVRYVISDGDWDEGCDEPACEFADTLRGANEPKGQPNRDQINADVRQRKADEAKRGEGRRVEATRFEPRCERRPRRSLQYAVESDCRQKQQHEAGGAGDSGSRDSSPAA